MAVQHRVSAAAAGIGNQPFLSGFDKVLVAVGHHQRHAADGIAKNIRRPGVTAIAVAITGHLMEQDGGILLRQHLAVLIMIAQMHHMLGV